MKHNFKNCFADEPTSRSFNEKKFLETSSHTRREQHMSRGPHPARETQIKAQCGPRTKIVVRLWLIRCSLASLVDNHRFVNRCRQVMLCISDSNLAITYCTRVQSDNKEKMLCGPHSVVKALRTVCLKPLF
jgi:hypothetical protein